MKIQTILAAMLMAAVMTGCASRGHDHDKEESGHDHEEHLQLTAYNDEFELYAVATPFVVGEESEILAHFTHLRNFKPLESGKVGARMVVGASEERQTANKPSHPGIYEFSITPKSAGKGQIIFDIDGKSQITLDICVYSEEHEAEHAAEEALVSSSNAVSFPKEKSWKVDFSTEECSCAPFGQVIRTMAQVQSAQADERVIVAKAGGVVSFSSNGLVEGQAVKAGQTLFKIESGDMTEDNLTVRYSEIESNYNLTKKEYERKQTLAKEKIVSESDLLQAKAAYEAAKAQYDNIRKNYSEGSLSVTAPFEGYVRQLLAANGEYVEAGEPIVAISRNRDLLLRAEIQGKYYPLLKNISSASIKLPGSDRICKLEELDGRLVSYGRSVSADSPLLPVVFRVSNKVDLLPGTFVEMFINTRSERNCLTVPCESLVEEMGNYFAFVQLTPEFFEKREVKIGQSDGERVEIISGLSEGERVVAKGAVLVKLSQASATLDAHSGHAH